MATRQSPMLILQAIAQQQQQQQQQPVSQPASQSAPPLQTAAQAPAAANGSGSHDPSKSLRMAESAAQHEAYYKAKMQEAQVTVMMWYVLVLVAIRALSCIKHKLCVAPCAAPALQQAHLP